MAVDQLKAVTRAIGKLRPTLEVGDVVDMTEAGSDLAMQLEFEKRQKAGQLAESTALAQADIAGSSGDNVVQSLAQANIPGSSGDNVVQSFSMVTPESEHGEGDAPTEDSDNIEDQESWADLTQQERHKLRVEQAKQEFKVRVSPQLLTRKYIISKDRTFLKKLKVDVIKEIAKYRKLPLFTSNLRNIPKLSLIDAIMVHDLNP